jgi:hypothetical protein
MTPTIVAAAAEYAAIHLAVCRYRKQGLVCSTCSDVAERAERIAARHGWGRCPCGDEDWLIGGLCEPCRVVEAA